MIKHTKSGYVDQDLKIPVRAFLDMSIGHVTQSDADLLSYCANERIRKIRGSPGTFPGCPLIVSVLNPGFVVRVLPYEAYEAEERQEAMENSGFSAEFIALISFVHDGNEYNGLWLDPDAEQSSHFPTFSW